VLGPKLFNLYMMNLTKHTQGCPTTTYADDTYVLIKGKNMDELKHNAESCLKSHLAYLDSQGMVTNVSKTEVVVFGQNNKVELEIDGNKITSGETMKVLGVQFDSDMKWSSQAKTVIVKLRRLNSGLKFLRRKLNTNQFLKVLTAQYYSTCYYGGEVWLNSLGFDDKRRMNALHYRTLRIVLRDYRRKLHRSSLDELGRARPTTWANYLTCSRIIKTCTNHLPKRLYEMLKKNSYSERRYPGRLKFFDASRRKVGQQMIANRAGRGINGASFDWLDGISHDLMRINLKRLLNMNNNRL